MRSAHGAPFGSPEPTPLDVLSRRLREARSAVHRQRQGRAASPELDCARRELVAALEDYTRALEKRRLPVPQSLLTELRLLRGLFR